MRIGLVTEWFARGSGFVSAAYVKTLEGAGCEVGIFSRQEQVGFRATAWQHEQKFEGKEIRFIKQKAFTAESFRSWLKDFRPELILFNEQVWIPPVELAKSQGITCASYVDYYTRDSVQDYAIYDLLLTNTQRHFDTFSWHPNCQFIPWGTDLERFRPASKEVYVNRPGPIFLHSAGWNPYRKGTDLVIRGFLDLTAPEARLKVATQTPIAAIEDLLGDAWQRVRDDDRISIEVNSDAGPNFFQTGDVYVYPSRLEGIGLTQAEALASGLPLLVTDEEPMKQFAQSPWSVTVGVSHHFYRDDGYYWPMAEVDSGSVTASMDHFVCTFENRAEWVADSREYAEHFLDWDVNSSELPNILGAARNTDSQVRITLSRRAKLELLISDLPAPLLRGVVSMMLFLRRWRKRWRTEEDQSFGSCPSNAT